MGGYKGVEEIEWGGHEVEEMGWCGMGDGEGIKGSRNWIGEGMGARKRSGGGEGMNEMGYDGVA